MPIFEPDRDLPRLARRLPGLTASRVRLRATRVLRNDALNTRPLRESEGVESGAAR